MTTVIALAAPSGDSQGGTVTVPRGTLSGVLVKPADLSHGIMLRVTSGPLKGAIAEGSFSSNAWVFIDIDKLETANGTRVEIPACKWADAFGTVNVPRVQVDRGEWTQVRNGGIAAAGTEFHIRLLGPVQFDRSPETMQTVLAKN